MYVQNHVPDTASLLADLAGGIREYHEPVDRYLQQSGEYEVVNPFGNANEISTLPMKAAFAHTCWERLGIRHIISNSTISRTASQNQWPVAEDKVPHGWNDLKKGTCLQSLGAYISNSSVIEFADFANVNDAAGFWDGLFADVIKPLKKRDFEFVFQLGDVTSRRVFEVDEILDIIGDYSSHGRVSLVLDEQEAGKLWNALHGNSYNLSNAKEKYRFLFNAVRIDALLVFYNNGVLFFSKDEQLDFAGRSFDNIHTYSYNKDFFLAGFRLGLLLHVDIPHAIALGLAVSGAYRATASIPVSWALLAYIKDWMWTISKI